MPAYTGKYQDAGAGIINQESIGIDSIVNPGSNCFQTCRTEEGNIQQHFSQNLGKALCLKKETSKLKYCITRHLYFYPSRHCL